MLILTEILLFTCLLILIHYILLLHNPLELLFLGDLLSEKALIFANLLQKQIDYVLWISQKSILCSETRTMSNKQQIWESEWSVVLWEKLYFGVNKIISALS